jgi:hypothetical protein
MSTISPVVVTAFGAVDASLPIAMPTAASATSNVTKVTPKIRFIVLPPWFGAERPSPRRNSS